MSKVIRGGTIVTADRTYVADVLVEGEKIAAIGEGLTGDEEVDASEAYVVPGGIDPHVHLEMPFMGTHSTDDFYTGTVAAASGGTTTVVDFCIPAPDGSMLQAWDEWAAKSKDKAAEDWRKHVEARAADAPPSRPLSAYARTYRDPWYGDIVVEQGKDGLVMRFSRTPDLVGRMEPWQHDTFVVRWNERWLNADAFVTFSLDADGKVREGRMEAISPLTDFSFDFQDLRLTPVEEKSES